MSANSYKTWHTISVLHRKREQEVIDRPIGLGQDDWQTVPLDQLAGSPEPFSLMKEFGYGSFESVWKGQLEMRKRGAHGGNKNLVRVSKPPQEFPKGPQILSIHA